VKKIVVIGAGSIIFSTTVTNDLLATPALRDSELVLVDPVIEKARRVENYVRRIVAQNGLAATIRSTTDRREALRGADFVVTTIKIGGAAAFQVDYEVPRKYGIDVCVGECVGPGGVFRALRTIPVIVDIVRDVQDLCPHAVLLNYVNPMAMICMAIGRTTRLEFTGLCHGVQTTLDLIGRYVDVPKEKVDFLCAGINHMAWFLKLTDKRDGRDLYPVLMANMEKPEYYLNEKVRGEVMRHFGYFMTESTGHLSEYIPWFRSHERALAQYCDQPDFGGASGAYYKYGVALAEKYRDVDPLELSSPKLGGRSVEYCSYILEALETGRPFHLNGNVRNDGWITNLPDGCCVEVPVVVDKEGIHPQEVGSLPPQCAALNQSNVTVQSLCVEAGLQSDPELVMAAVAMDPLTSACCTLKEARQMTTAMLDAEQEWLPGFAGRRPVPRPDIRIPKGTRGVDVPTDPALAIANRFGKLATQRA